MESSSLIETFYRARQDYLAAKLMRWEDLQTLRQRIDEAQQDSTYCDGCGFCCHSVVPMTRLEFERIQRLLEADPDLLQLQGMVCPFLGLERQQFDRNLEVYGQEIARLEPAPCRIYDERPIICRMWPAPESKHCRKHSALEAPDVNEALKEEDDEDYPQLLIQRYHITLEWECRDMPRQVLDPELSFHLVPGWRVDREQGSLVSSDGPAWINGIYFSIPDAFPKPDQCELDDWAVEVLSAFETPTPYLPVLERHAKERSVEEIATLLTQCELANILCTLDAAKRAAQTEVSIWGWLQHGSAE